MFSSRNRIALHSTFSYQLSAIGYQLEAPDRVRVPAGMGLSADS
jgi:hypothetical protein